MRVKTRIQHPAPGAEVRHNRVAPRPKAVPRTEPNHPLRHGAAPSWTRPLPSGAGLCLEFQATLIRVSEELAVTFVPAHVECHRGDQPAGTHQAQRMGAPASDALHVSRHVHISRMHACAYRQSHAFRRPARCGSSRGAAWNPFRSRRLECCSPNPPVAASPAPIRSTAESGCPTLRRTAAQRSHSRLSIRLA